MRLWEVEDKFYRWAEDYKADNGFADYAYETWRGMAVGKVTRHDLDFPYVACVEGEQREFAELEEAKSFVENMVRRGRNWFEHIIGRKDDI